MVIPPNILTGKVSSVPVLAYELCCYNWHNLVSMNSSICQLHYPIKYCTPRTMCRYCQNADIKDIDSDTNKILDFLIPSFILRSLPFAMNLSL